MDENQGIPKFFMAKRLWGIFNQIDKLTRYIQFQHEHHLKIVFQDEFRKLLRLYNIEWDERYVWD